MAWDDYHYDLGFDEEQEPPENHAIEYLEVAHETDKARLISTTDGQFWVPKSISLIEEDHKVIVIDHWFTIKYLHAA